MEPLMAQFTLEIADTDVNRVTAALSQAGGFTDHTEENALSTVMTFIQQTITNVETANARAVALASVKPPTPLVLTPGAVAAPAAPVTQPVVDTPVTPTVKSGPA